MISSRDKPHWWGRRRYAAHGRMAWYGEPGDERYWLAYWKARLTPDYYVQAGALSPGEDELGRVLLEYVPVGGLHLEAGCGAGYWVAALRAKGMQIEGIEYARELVDVVHEANPRLPVRVGDALAIDRPDCTYDTYLSIGVVEHRAAGPEPFLAEAYRVLKPGGKIMIAVPFFGPLRRLKQRLFLYDREAPALPFFQYGFGRRELRCLLEKAGFAVLYAQPLYAHRLLQEELWGYDWLATRAALVKWLAEWLLKKREGHMVLMVGEKLNERI